VTTVTAFLKQGADLGSFRLDSILLGHPLVLALLLLGGDACLGASEWSIQGGATLWLECVTHLFPL
ncbi:hypothetical protein D0N87_34375, partial [Pseudomonas sp. ATCC 13867]